MLREHEKVIHIALNRREKFFEKTKGLTSSQMTQALSRFVSGHDYTGCSKALMADEYAIEGYSEIILERAIAAATEQRDRFKP